MVIPTAKYAHIKTKRIIYAFFCSFTLFEFMAFNIFYNILLHKTVKVTK